MIGHISIIKNVSHRGQCACIWTKSLISDHLPHGPLTPFSLNTSILQSFTVQDHMIEQYVGLAAILAITDMQTKKKYVKS